MQVTLEFVSDSEVSLPIQYNHILQGFIYTNLSHKDYKNFLHEKGYEYEGKSFKGFSYSRLLGEYSLDKEKGIIKLRPPVRLVISSAVEEFLQDLIFTLMKTREMYLGGNKISLETFRINRAEINDGEIEIEMLSPLVLYTTVMSGDKKRTNYISPWDVEFQELIKSNIRNKYRAIIGAEPNMDDFHISCLETPKEVKKAVIIYKGTIINGWLGRYNIKGDKAVLNFIHGSGLGAKNSQGFGCFRVL